MDFDIFVGLASAASIVSVLVVMADQIRKGAYLAFILTIVAMGALGFAGYRSFTEFQEKLLTRQFAGLDLPPACVFTSQSNDDRCGFIMSVMLVLEQHREGLPRFFSQASQQQVEACGVAALSKSYLERRDVTTHVARSLCEVVRQVRQTREDEPSGGDA